MIFTKLIIDLRRVVLFRELQCNLGCTLKSRESSLCAPALFPTSNITARIISKRYSYYFSIKTRERAPSRNPLGFKITHSLLKLQIITYFFVDEAGLTNCMELDLRLWCLFKIISRSNSNKTGSIV